MNFFTRFAEIQNTAQSRSIVLSGNIHDIFWDGENYVSLIQFLTKKTQNFVHLVYELNGPIRMADKDKSVLLDAWVRWRLDGSSFIVNSKEWLEQVKIMSSRFEDRLKSSIGNPTLALEFLRQITFCSREFLPKHNLLIIIEAADMLLPAGNGDVASLNDNQLRRISIVQDWISDANFVDGHDTVLFLAESRSLIHPRVSKLPQVINVEIPNPDLEERKLFLEKNKVDNFEDISKLTAGLSLFALKQLVRKCKGIIPLEEITPKVEEYLKSQLGEDVIEFKKPTHKIDSCVGFSSVKKFIEDELIPRMKIAGDGSLSGCAVAGPIGGGKTFIFEAVAAELDMPVLVLKNIRSQWFGQTDVIIEKFRRVIESLDRVLIFMDEADTMLGGLGSDTHETERRLTGKIQMMMSDPSLKNKVYWLLMTARIHMLSPDIRRPGRVGDLIIPILDPTGKDKYDFINWVFGKITINQKPALELFENRMEILYNMLPEDYSSASYASLKSNLKYIGNFENEEHLFSRIKDFIQPAIATTRRYQTLQALVNCTRRSLLPDPNISEEGRNAWNEEITKLENQGIK